MLSIVMRKGRSPTSLACTLLSSLACDQKNRAYKKEKYCVVLVVCA